MSIEKSLILVCSAALLSMPAMAQQVAPILRPGAVEVGGFVGASYGIDQTRVMGGGNVVYSLSTIFMPFGEVSYFPGIGRSESIPGVGGTQVYSIPLVDFNAGLHLRVPIPKSRIIPYGVISAGGIHTPSRTNTVTYPNPVIPTQTETASIPISASTDFAVSFGAGIRYYTTERFGFRAEFKAYKPLDTPANSNNVFYRVAGGIFYQF